MDDFADLPDSDDTGRLPDDVEDLAELLEQSPPVAPRMTEWRDRP